MAEVAAVGRDHRDARGIDGGDDVLVAHRAARLDDRRDARVDRELRAVGEGEEGVGGERRAGEQLGLGGAGPSRPRSAPRRPGSSGRRRSRSSRRRRRCTIALERTCRQTFQANSRSSHSRLARLPRGHHAHLLARLGDDVAGLHELRRRSPACLRPRGWARGQSRELEQAHVLLRLQHLQRVGVVAGREQHLDELLARAARRRRDRRGG